MNTSFYIPTERLSELKTFVRDELPTARFRHNPLQVGDKWLISLNLEVEDGNKLSQLQSDWDRQDKPPKKYESPLKRALKSIGIHI